MSRFSVFSQTERRPASGDATGGGRGECQIYQRIHNRVDILHNQVSDIADFDRKQADDEDRHRDDEERTDQSTAEPRLRMPSNSRQADDQRTDGKPQKRAVRIISNIKRRKQKGKQQHQQSAAHINPIRPNHVFPSSPVMSCEHHRSSRSSPLMDDMLKTPSKNIHFSPNFLLPLLQYKP